MRGKTQLRVLRNILLHQIMVEFPDLSDKSHQMSQQHMFAFAIFCPRHMSGILLSAFHEYSFLHIIWKVKDRHGNALQHFFLVFPSFHYVLHLVQLFVSLRGKKKGLGQSGKTFDCQQRLS